MNAESGASISSAPGNTGSIPLISDVTQTSADALVVEGGSPISVHLDTAGGSHIESGVSGGSATYITDPAPSIPDVNHPSVGTLEDDKDHFHIPDPLDTAGGSHIDSIDQTFPLTEPWAHFSPDRDCLGRDDLRVDDFNVDLDGELLLCHISCC
jgi:hypothetical protein